MTMISCIRRPRVPSPPAILDGNGSCQSVGKFINSSTSKVQQASEG
jgi:hypothetical protein